MPRRAKKVFTLEEASALLPRVRELTRRAREAFLALPPAGEDEEGHRLLEAEAARILHEWAASVLALGAEVKGPWLVDFDSGGGYYCWTWPEETIDFFHGYEDGFAGRVRLQ